MRKQSSKELTNEYNTLERLKEHQKRWKNILRDQKYVKKEKEEMTKRKDVDPEKSKRARGAKQKGSRAQREVAKLLGLWFFADEEAFHSTPGSGSLRWGRDIAGTRGDIVCSVDLEFPYSIEIKNQEKGQWDLLSLLFNEGPILNKWWKQCEEDAEVVGKIPWLIFTRNQVPFISVIKDFDGKYLKTVSSPSFIFGEYYIVPLAILLSYNPQYISTHLIQDYKTEKESNKILQRHFINPLKRIDKDAVSK